MAPPAIDRQCHARGMSPLMWAARRGHVAVARALFELCADGNAYARAPPSLVLRDANQVRVGG